MFPPSSLGISQGWGLIDLPLRAFIGILFSIQCPATQGREELLTAAVERGPSEGARSGSRKKLLTPLRHTF